MEEKELRRMSRASLLEVILLQGRENKTLQEENDFLRRQIEDRYITVKESGNLAEACLRLNHIFDDAESAVEQYKLNLARRSEQEPGDAAADEISAISGATITSTAVVNAVNAASDFATTYMMGGK